MRRCSRLIRLLQRRTYRVCQILLALHALATVSCSQGSTELEPIKSFIAQRAGGNILILQPGDCESRNADLRLVKTLLAVDAVAVVDNGTVQDAELASLVSTFGVIPRLRMSRSAAATLYALGVSSTPALISWNKNDGITLAFSLSQNRAILLSQLRSAARDQLK